MFVKSLSVSIIQCRTKYGNLNQLKHTITSIFSKRNNECDLILMPEFLFPSPIDCQEIEGSLITYLQSYAELMGSWIVCGSVPCISPKGLTQRTYVINDAGAIAGYYDEIHSGPINIRTDSFVSGSLPFLFNMGGTKLAIATANDLCFPEFIRSMALAEVAVICLPVFCPIELKDVLLSILRSRAFENGVFMLLSSGLEELTTAVGPDGTIITTEELPYSPFGEINVEIDLLKAKKMLNFAYNRYARKDIYFPL